MTSDQLCKAVTQLGLKNRDLSALTGVCVKTVSFWRNGASPVPIYVQTIVRMKLGVDVTPCNQKQGSALPA